MDLSELRGRIDSIDADLVRLFTERMTISGEIAAYLAGETVPGPQVGWTLLTVDGLSLGWVKGSGGVLKNHLPKGLRRMVK